MEAGDLGNADDVPQAFVDFGEGGVAVAVVVDVVEETAGELLALGGDGLGETLLESGFELLDAVLLLHGGGICN